MSFSHLIPAVPLDSGMKVEDTAGPGAALPEPAPQDGGLLGSDSREPKSEDTQGTQAQQQLHMTAAPQPMQQELFGLSSEQLVRQLELFAKRPGSLQIQAPSMYFMHLPNVQPVQL